MSADRDAVVTGVGALTPLAPDADRTWAALLDGATGIAPISRFDPEAAGLSSTMAGEVAADPADRADVDGRRTGRYAGLAVAAGRAALADAGLAPDGGAWRPGAVGVSVGSGMGGFPEIERTVEADRVSPSFPVTHLPNLAAGHLAELVGAEGPIRAPATACAAGTHAVGEALRDVRAGRADAVLAGGAEAAISPHGVGGFDAMRALSTRTDDPAAASRPFDADRDGFVVAEGAAVLVVEARAHAADRGAAPLAELAGFARTADAHHPTAPPEDAHGLRRCMRAALADAGRPPAAVDHVNAHATGTPRGDRHEATAVRAVFDDPPPVTSVKGATGHALGASGAIEAAIAVRSIAEGVRPPTATHETPDPACAVPVVETPTAAGDGVVLSNSAGFGGANGTLVVAGAGA
ncbi:MAG: beta-ketoacyl synthase [Haloferacaceae archaeon]